MNYLLLFGVQVGPLKVRMVVSSSTSGPAQSSSAFTSEAKTSEGVETCDNVHSQGGHWTDLDPSRLFIATSLNQLLSEHIRIFFCGGWDVFILRKKEKKHVLTSDIFVILISIKHIIGLLEVLYET